MRKNLTVKRIAITNMKALAASEKIAFGYKPALPQKAEKQLRAGLPPIAYFSKIEDKQKSLDEYIENLDYTGVIDQLEDLKKEEKKLISKAAKVRDMRNAIIASNFKGGMESITQPIVFRYRGKNEDLYFDGDGIPVEGEPNEPHHFIELEKKSNNRVDIPYGLKLDLGAMIFQVSDVSIGKNGLNIKPLNIVVRNISGHFAYGNGSDKYGTITLAGTGNNWRSRVRSDEFVQKFFNLEDNTGFEQFNDLCRLYRRNANFEVIAREIHDRDLRNSLLGQYTEEKKKIHELLGFENKQQYNMAKELGVVEAYRRCINEYKYNYNYNFSKREDRYIRPEDLGMTYANYVKLLAESLEVEKQFDDEGMDYPGYAGGGLFIGLAWSYRDNEILRERRKSRKMEPVKFQEYFRYIIKEARNQLYSSVNAYMTEHRDYLEMCKKEGAPAVYDTNSLTYSHRVATKNYSAHYTTEQEVLFMKAYESFKKWEGEEYQVTAPENIADLKSEGTELNHCVFSYVPRVIRDDSKVYFLRKKDNLPLVTLEIKGTEIIQMAGFSNRDLTDAETEAVKAFAKDRKMTIRGLEEDEEGEAVA